MILLLAACAEGAKLDTRDITVGGHAITVELADEPAERTVGLMYRDSLGADAGMLFVYPDAKPRNFWMKDTKIPLTIAYVDSAGVIVHLADMTPLDTTPVPSEKPAQFCLEMNRGWFAKNGITEGAVLGNLPAPSER